MAPFLSTLRLLGGACLIGLIDNVNAAAIEKRALSAYAPISVVCPVTELVRVADGISWSESLYVAARKIKADESLAAWLKKTDSSFTTTTLPSVALAVSGGGFRSLLVGAGVIQAFDSRDSDAGTAGVYQGLTYHAGLSGGAWLLSSFAGNNWPTISDLQKNLWDTTFQDSLFDPEEFLAAAAYAEIVDAIIAKDLAGFDPTIVDVYGRLLGYLLLEEEAGGVKVQLSGLTDFSNFTTYNVPFPIITSRGLLPGDCEPDYNATQYEFSPYEFGSWDEGVKAFAQTKYLGSSLTNGQATHVGKCITNYDNLGYVAGTSSDVFNEVCEALPQVNSTTVLAETLEAVLAFVEDSTERDLYAVYPNPFYKFSGSSLVESEVELNLVDGGEAGQNVPLWPFIQDARCVDVVIVSDNSADTDINFPNGTELHMTYLQAQLQGLTKMPFIPEPGVFIDEGLDKNATFFGCYDDSVITIVYLPNQDYDYASNTSTSMLEYTDTQLAGMISDGNLIATQGGDAEWPTCLGCAIMKKTGETLPEACTACFDKYCYVES